MNDFNLVIEEIARDGVECRKDVELSGFSWIKCGGKVASVIYPSSVDELCAVLKKLRCSGVKPRIFGNTSNVFFNAQSNHICFISTKRIKGFVIEGDEKDIVIAECGASLTAIARATARAGLGGMEGLVGIPATVGGAVFMNAGSYGCEISQCFIDAEYLDDDLVLRTIDKSAMKFSRRMSAFRAGEVSGTILRARFKVRKSSPESLLARITWVSRHRKENQESEAPNLGTLCTTKNFYRSILLENRRFAVVCGPFLMLIRMIGRIERWKWRMRRIENKVIKIWFRYPFDYQMHSDFSLNCYINKSGKPNDFIAYCNWLKSILKERFELENELIE
jgi:UDP-N-acetylmuramate dehydrogenase